MHAHVCVPFFGSVWVTPWGITNLPLIVPYLCPLDTSFSCFSPAPMKGHLVLKRPKVSFVLFPELCHISTGLVMIRSNSSCKNDFSLLPCAADTLRYCSPPSFPSWNRLSPFNTPPSSILLVVDCFYLFIYFVRFLFIYFIYTVHSMVHLFTYPRAHELQHLLSLSTHLLSSLFFSFQEKPKIKNKG